MLTPRLANHFPLRPYAVALAHVVVNSRIGSPEAERHNERYLALSPAEKLVCRAEIAACRAAKRGEAVAVVS